MKKYLKLLFAAIFATLSFALVSCGDDDDDNGALVGTWVGSYVEYDGSSYTDEITFTKDGKFSSTSTAVYHGQIYVDSVNGTYTVSGDLKEGAVVYMVGVNSDGDNVDARIFAKVSGDLLYTIDSERDTIVFTRK